MLVLGAGGHAAEAWQIGVLLGLEDEGVHVRESDVLVGTLAGARVAVALAKGRSLAQLYDEQLAPDAGVERASAEAVRRWREAFGKARGEGSEGGEREKRSPRELLQRLGALEAEVITPRQPRRSILAATLPLESWPDRDLRVVAVDTNRGERVVLRAASGVPVIDAIEASGAVPGLFPAVVVDGRHLVNGGAYSVDNADVVSDCEETLVLTLRAKEPPMGVVATEENVERLKGSGTRVELVQPDEAAEAAFESVHGNVLDPAVRRGAVEAGRAQGRGIAGRVGKR